MQGGGGGFAAAACPASVHPTTTYISAFIALDANRDYADPANELRVTAASSGNDTKYPCLSNILYTGFYELTSCNRDSFFVESVDQTTPFNLREVRYF